MTEDDRERVEHMVSLRLTGSDLERLDAIVSGSPILARLSLLRAAMRIGLDAVEANPAILLGQPVPQRGGSRKRKKR